MLLALQQEKYDIFPVSRGNGFDIRNKEDNLRYLREARPDVIVNCAAHVGSLNYVSQYAADVIYNNSSMITAMYEAVKEACPSAVIIQPVANCAYPANATIFREEEFWNGQLHPSVLSYGFTRRMLMTISECYKMQHDIRSINLLTPNMYGPYDSTDPNKAHALNALISKFVKAIETGQDQVEIWGTGIAIREWLYAADFARIVLHILKDINNSVYDTPVNIAQEHGLSVKELVDLILKNVSYKGETFYNKNMPDGAPRKVMSKYRFEQVFPGFSFTPFDEGIAETAKYYKSVYPW